MYPRERRPQRTIGAASCSQRSQSQRTVLRAGICCLAFTSKAYGVAAAARLITRRNARQLITRFTIAALNVRRSRTCVAWTCAQRVVWDYVERACPSHIHVNNATTIASSHQHHRWTPMQRNQLKEAAAMGEEEKDVNRASIRRAPGFSRAGARTFTLTERRRPCRPVCARKARSSSR